MSCFLVVVSVLVFGGSVVALLMGKGGGLPVVLCLLALAGRTTNSPAVSFKGEH